MLKFVKTPGLKPVLGKIIILKLKYFKNKPKAFGSTNSTPAFQQRPTDQSQIQKHLLTTRNKNFFSWKRNCMKKK